MCKYISTKLYEGSKKTCRIAVVSTFLHLLFLQESPPPGNLELDEEVSDDVGPGIASLKEFSSIEDSGAY